MFRLFVGRTAHEVWLQAATAIGADKDVSTQSGRGGATREILHAALTIKDPRQRWVIIRDPPLNPAFAIVEVVWMLSGRRDSAFLNYWNRELPKYAGEGAEYHGAYGYRLRHHFGLDQLERAYEALCRNPDGRQIVLQIWDPAVDLPHEDGTPRSQDIPCNLLSMLKVRSGKLEWMQIMRSNDLFLGLPYNFLQFTTLQEVLAGWLRLDLGAYHQLSDSLHVYLHAIDSFSIDPSVQVAENTDSLLLPRELSQSGFAVLNRRFEAMTDRNLTFEELEQLAIADELPATLGNMLRVVGAEAARRRRWRAAADQIASGCTNPVLKQVWDRWVRRFPDAR